MPAIIKIIINIKLIVMLLFLNQTHGFRNQGFWYEMRPRYTNVAPGFSQDSVIMKWMNTETALRKAYLNLIKSLLPSAYGISYNLSPNCTYSLLEYMGGLKNMKSWAFKMFDATGMVPNGLTGGTPMAIGDFDTCLDIVSPNQKFKGQYCYLELLLPLPERKVMTHVDAPIEEIRDIFEPESIFEHLTKYARFLYNAQLRMTVCLPSTCTNNDIKQLFSNAMSYIKSSTEISIPYCEVKEDQKFTALENFIIVLFIFLISLVVLGTFIDILLRNHPKYDLETTKSITIKALLCFSAYTNYTRLIKVDNNPDTLHTFHGLRVLSMTWIIWGHSFNVVSYRAYDGSFHSKDMGKDVTFQMVPMGFLAVENFFFMSSVLVSYTIARMRGKTNMPLLFLRRYLRLTPTFMLVVAFFAIIGRFGSGPLWKETIVDTLSKNCLERGWLNLFYVNNYLYGAETCLGWSWYLSTDTQMFIVSLYICYIMKRKSGRGLLAAGLALMIGIVSTAFYHIYYKLPPTFLQSFVHYDDWYFYAIKGYTQVQFHLTVCAVGIVVGYLLATKKFHIPKHLNVIGWVLSITTFFTLLYLTHKFNQGKDAIPGVFVSALYGSLHRLAWALSLGFVTLSCTWGQGGIANSILCWEGFIPFARLTYMVYLVHYGLIYVITASTRQTMTFGYRTLVFLFFNTMVVSFLVAFLLGLLFESPFTALEKAFWSGKLKKQIQPVNATNGTVALKNAA